MSCRQLGSAIVCGPRAGGRRRPDRPPCRVPGCPRDATQAGWGCRPHWFRLSPDLRNHLYMAHRDDQLGSAWLCAAADADRWLAEHPLGRPRHDRRQSELPFDVAQDRPL